MQGRDTAGPRARGGQVFIWLRGEELITDRFPDMAAPGDLLPEGTVPDGDTLAHLKAMLAQYGREVIEA